MTLEPPDLVGGPPGPAYNLERDYRPRFAEIGCDLNVWVGPTSIGADINPTEQSAGRLWGALVKHAKRRHIFFGKPSPIMPMEDAEAEMRRQLDGLLRERPWEKTRRWQRAHPKD